MRFRVALVRQLPQRDRKHQQEAAGGTRRDARSESLDKGEVLAK